MGAMHTDVRRRGKNDARDVSTGHLSEDTLASSASLLRACLHETRNRAKSIFADIETMCVHVQRDV